MSRLEQKKRERENKATMEADMQQALAEKEVVAKQVRLTLQDSGVRSGGSLSLSAFKKKQMLPQSPQTSQPALHTVK